MAQKLTRRKMLLVASCRISGLVLTGVPPPQVFAKTSNALSPADAIAIEDLNALPFYALDGLDELITGDPGIYWANTFTPNGTFSIVQEGKGVLLKVMGFAQLVAAYKTFPDIATTRHWINDLIIEPDIGGAKAGCYIIAVDIKSNPAKIIRSGLYKDRLVKVGNNWKFLSRTLLLDPNSPAGGILSK